MTEIQQQKTKNCSVASQPNSLPRPNWASQPKAVAKILLKAILVIVTVLPAKWMLRCWTSLPCSMETGSGCGWEASFFEATITTEESVGTVRYILVYTYMVICHIYAHDIKTYLSKRKYLFQSQIWSFNSELQTELQTADDAQWPEGCHAEHSKSLLNYAILKLYLKPYSIIFVIINLCYSEIMCVGSFLS